MPLKLIVMNPVYTYMHALFDNHPHIHAYAGPHSLYTYMQSLPHIHCTHTIMHCSSLLCTYVHAQHHILYALRIPIHSAYWLRKSARDSLKRINKITFSPSKRDSCSNDWRRGVFLLDTLNHWLKIICISRAVGLWSLRKHNTVISLVMNSIVNKVNT